MSSIKEFSNRLENITVESPFFNEIDCICTYHVFICKIQILNRITNCFKKGFQPTWSFAIHKTRISLHNTEKYITLMSPRNLQFNKTRFVWQEHMISYLNASGFYKTLLTSINVHWSGFIQKTCQYLNLHWDLTTTNTFTTCFFSVSLDELLQRNIFKGSMLIKHLHFITIIEHECLIIRRLVSRQFMVRHTNYKMSSNVSGIFHIVGLKI